MAFPAECPRNFPPYTEHSSCQCIFTSLAVPINLCRKKKKRKKERKKNTPPPNKTHTHTHPRLGVRGSENNNLSNVHLFVFGNLWSFLNYRFETHYPKITCGCGQSGKPHRFRRCSAEDPWTKGPQEGETGICCL